MDYKTIKEETTFELDKKVLKYLENGYQLHGEQRDFIIRKPSVSFDTIKYTEQIYFIQVMIKFDNEKFKLN